ncbi:MAG: HAMP domain-containing protein [Acidobacteria bacterium]|nr:HAMP domain-containing protein [Acidobacteriota bacterium]
MRIGIKGKQVIGVTSIVGAVVVALSLVHLSNLARVKLEESRARAELLANAIFHRAREVIGAGVDPYEALRADPGLRSILESSLYSKNVTFAAIVDVNGVAVVHADPGFEGRAMPSEELLSEVLAKPAQSELAAIYSGQGRNLEFRQPLLLGNTEFGSIRIGVSTLLIRQDLGLSLKPAVATALAALVVAIGVAVLLAQLLLRPIHMIRSGLTRLGRGELDVHLDLDQSDEFGELGTSFNAVSAQLSADRSQMAGQVANLESAVEHLEDALAIVSPRGELLFANPAMRTLLPDAASGMPLSKLVAPDHPVLRLSEQTLMTGQSRGPLAATFPDIGGGESGERLVTTHAVNDAKGQLVGIMFIARNREYLSQMQSTIRYSRKLAALGRLSAGVAHEVKNPLNAMMIHLELLRQQFALPPVAGSTLPEPQRRSDLGRGLSSAAPAPVATVAAPGIDAAAALRSVDVIADEIRRLDEVVQGFIKFSRPEDLRLQPVNLDTLFKEIVPIVQPEAERAHVDLRVECDAPDVNGDPAMLRQAFLNLALNACQAMPDGGTLRVRCEAAGSRRVAVSFADTGVGIKPEHLSRIFNLYFTTKATGSGIGLSMVYRTVQMHDGEIEVQSTPGAGTTFRVLLPQA